MEQGRFYETTTDPKILQILEHMTRETILSLRRICERYGEGEEDVRHYDVYSLETPSGRKILKKTEERETFNYTQYLAGKSLPVPDFFGKWEEAGDIWILIEEIEGEDLRNMTDALTLAAADALAQLQNAYWQEGEEEFSDKKTDDRFAIYWNRILRRAASVADQPTLRKAYDLFLNRQPEAPRTLSNGDFLQFNLVHTAGRVTVIDWGFGGIMPYSLDIARFIAHATETACTFPFYMTDGQKKLFLERVYEKLDRKPPYIQFIRDIRLAVLNEYSEFVEAEEDETGWYLTHALQLAEELLAE